ncbi:hypothetical protein Taro_033907 [Colocasia esculenta]|uniref:Uncharacterized protein n=1 Tax=Colocasia esculenta TaxID=4460 RepID=A0A843W1E2_COLES|nr:hypothetical protein [Colocasia esculenta]
MGWGRRGAPWEVVGPTTVVSQIRKGKVEGPRLPLPVGLCEEAKRDMVRGARSGSSSGKRMSSGRGFSAASGSGQFTPPPPTVPTSGPFSVPPPLAAGSGQFTPPPPRVLGSGQFTPSPAIVHFSGPIYRFNDFPMEVQELLYQMFMSADPTLWRERAPTWMRRDYWEGLCNIWAAERWQETSTTMKVNRAAILEANKHTSGSVSFATHQSRLEKELKRPPTFQEVFDKTYKKKGMNQHISDRAREVTELYSQQMTEKYAREEVWVAASSAPKKGHVYGFGHRMDMSRVLSGASSSGSQVTSPFTTPGALGISPSEMMGFI